jgi:hypothetical protein
LKETPRPPQRFPFAYAITPPPVGFDSLRGRAQDGRRPDTSRERALEERVDPHLQSPSETSL